MYLSLSARRAWIEMRYRPAAISPSPVALRKESVDRNTHPYLAYLLHAPSLSARRAWIEIFLVLSRSLEMVGRSPQGERG